MKTLWRIIFSALLFISLSLSRASASDVNLALRLQSLDNQVIINVENNSSQGVIISSVGFDLDKRKYAYSSLESIAPYKSKAFTFTVSLPPMRGSYPLAVTVKYLNDGKTLSLNHAGILNFAGESYINASCSIEDSTLPEEGSIQVKSEKPYLWRILLPDEIEMISDSLLPDRRVFKVRSKIKGFTNVYPVFAIAEDTVEGRHRTGLCSGMLTVDTIAPYLNKGRIPNGVLPVAAVMFLLSAFYCINRGGSGSFSTTLARYSSRMFFLAAAYFVLNNADSWLKYSIQYIDWKLYRQFMDAAVNNFQGKNYRNFFYYFIDVYAAACLVLTFPYLLYIDRKVTAEDDKYVAFFRTFISVPNITRGRGIYWNKLSRLGMLTLFVKFFFAPLLISWSVNNIFHITGALDALQWDFHTINAFMADLFILTDTVIFAFGYTVESRLLNSEIKSVEPTFLGWLVCLWCYPPFNAFSFKPFDHQLVSFAVNAPGGVQAAMTCAITLLWGIFAWASLSLGFKASNLTNRGIIKKGPYRFVRHPAYTVKLLIWIIQGIFFAQFGLGILAAFTAIYALRAWTEERHLSADADYIAYKKEVRWGFIPGMI